MNETTATPSGLLALSLDELAAAVGVSRRHLCTLISRGEGPAVVKLGRRRLVRREAADAWLRSREAA
jgi:excisionase family DNA binding protein